MKNIILNFVLSSIAHTFLFAQVPDTLWTKTYGDSSFDSGSSIVQTNENNFIISGSIGTQLSGNSYTSDIWVFGIDGSGTTLWSYNYGGMSGGEIVNTSNDEYYLAAETYNQGTQEDMQILKLTEAGDTIWTKTFYYTQHEYKPEIERTTDGGLIILGYTYGFPTGTLLIRINSSGDTLWTKLFSDNTYQLYPSSLEIDTDEGIVFLVQKLDSTFIYKTDSLGNLILREKISSDPYNAKNLLITEDGNYLTLGTYSPNFDSAAIWVSLFDTNLSTIWSNTFFSTKPIAYPFNIIKSNTTGYLLIGYESPDYISIADGLILKIDDSGDLLWRKSYGGLSMDYFNDIVLLDNNEFFVVGNTGSFGSGKTDAWVLKFSADTITTFVEDEFKIVLPDSYILYQNYRNPFNPSTVISYQLPVSSDVTLKVYDVLGNEVATLVDEYKPAGSYEVKWSASNHSSGVYFYQLHTGNFVETKKLILMK
jgi:hypothetical protein